MSYQEREKRILNESIEDYSLYKYVIIGSLRWLNKFE